MKILILAAGSGTRLGDETKFIPKSLISINKKTILERQLDIIQQNNERDISIIAGPNKDKFVKFGIDIFEDDEYQKHEQLGSLISINKIFENDVIVIFSDIIFDKNIFEKIVKTKCDFGIALDRNWKEKYMGRTEHPVSQADLVEVTNEKIEEIKKNLQGKNVTFLEEELGSDKKPTGKLIPVGKYKNDHKGKFHNAKMFNQAYITDIIQELIELNYYVKPIFVEGNWAEIDTPQDIEMANKKFN